MRETKYSSCTRPLIIFYPCLYWTMKVWVAMMCSLPPVVPEKSGNLITTNSIFFTNFK